MDTLASLALATEPPTEKLLDRLPHSRNDYILSKPMMKHVLGQSIYQFTVMMILVFSGDSWVPEFLPKELINPFEYGDSLKFYAGISTFVIIT